MDAPGIIDHAEQFFEFEPEWSQFVQRIGAANPFQTPEWLISWWKHFGSGTLRIWVFRNHGDVTGVLPCFLHDWEGRRQITLLGSGVSDYLDPLLEPACVPAMLDQIRLQLRRRNDWDVCNWQDLSADSPLIALGEPIPDSPCRIIPLQSSFEAYINARPRHVLRNLDVYRKKAGTVPDVSFEVTEHADAESMNALVNLHAARWKHTGESGMIEANRSESFLREAAARLANSGMLRIFTIRFGQRIAAVMVAFCNATTLFEYLTGFDPEYKSYGLGWEILAQALRYAHERGYKKWDFLRGDEPYKGEWGAQSWEKTRVIIQPAMLPCGRERP